MTWTDFLDRTALCLAANNGIEQLILHRIKEEEEEKGGSLYLPNEKDRPAPVVQSGERASKILNEMLCIGLANIDMVILARILESNDLFRLNGEVYCMAQRVSALLRICLTHNSNVNNIDNANGSYCCPDSALSTSMMAIDIINQCLTASDRNWHHTIQSLICHPFYSVKDGAEEQVYVDHLDEQAAVDYFNSRGPFTTFPNTIIFRKMNGLKCHLKETSAIDTHVLFEVSQQQQQLSNPLMCLLK